MIINYFSDKEKSSNVELIRNQLCAKHNNEKYNVCGFRRLFL